LLNCIPS